MTLTRRSVVAGLAAAPFTVPAFVRTARAADTVKVAVPQKGNWDSMVAVQGQEQGIFKKHGLDLDITYTSGGSDTIQVVATGGVDVAMATGTTASIGAYAHGTPVRIISAEMTGAPDLYWYVRAESPVKSMADMNGKTMGFSRPGSSSYTVCHLLASNAHVTPNFVSAGEIPAVRTMVMSGQLDAGWSAAPVNLDLVQQGKIRIIGRGGDVPQVRDQTIRVNIANTPFVQKSADVASRFLAAYAETITWMYADQAAALKRYLGWNEGMTLAVAQQVPKIIPKATMSLKVSGFDKSINDAISFKSIDKPLTADQSKEIFASVYAPYARG